MKPEDSNDAALLDYHSDNLCLLFPSFKTCERKQFLKSVASFSASWSSRLEAGSVAPDTQVRMNSMHRPKTKKLKSAPFKGLNANCNLSSSSAACGESEVRSALQGS